VTATTALWNAMVENDKTRIEIIEQVASLLLSSLLLSSLELSDTQVYEP